MALPMVGGRAEPEPRDSVQGGADDSGQERLGADPSDCGPTLTGSGSASPDEVPTPTSFVPPSREIRGVFYLVDDRNRAARMASTDIYLLRRRDYDAWLKETRSSYTRVLSPVVCARRAGGKFANELGKKLESIEQLQAAAKAQLEIAIASAGESRGLSRAALSDPAFRRKVLALEASTRQLKLRTLQTALASVELVSTLPSSELHAIRESVRQEVQTIVAHEEPRVQRRWLAARVSELEERAVSCSVTRIDGHFEFCTVPEGPSIVVAVLSVNERPTIYARSASRDSPDEMELTARDRTATFDVSEIAVTEKQLAAAEQSSFAKARRALRDAMSRAASEQAEIKARLERNGILTKQK